MNRVVFALVAILFLLFASSITGLIQVVRAESGTVTINADGSISPSTAPIYTADNITYTLTGNINITSVTDGIHIERDNIVLDGAGYTVNGSGDGNGTMLTGRSNVTLRDMTITNFFYGIYLGSSSNCTLSGNNVTANSNYGIYLGYSSGNTLSGNNVTANRYEGIFLAFSDNNTLSDNNVTANNGDGIYLESSTGNTLSGNTATANNYFGIILDFSGNNTISGNNVAANLDDGIYLDYSSSSILSGNNVTANKYEGIVLWSSFDNTIYQNNFKNTNQVYCYNSTNIWDNGSTGNYWSDYLTKYPNATETDSSGVWNTPYVIDTNNTDYYPLIVPIIVIPEFPSFLILPLMMMATLLAVIIYKKKGVRTSQS